MFECVDPCVRQTFIGVCKDGSLLTKIWFLEGMVASREKVTSASVTIAARPWVGKLLVNSIKNSSLSLVSIFFIRIWFFEHWLIIWLIDS